MISLLLSLLFVLLIAMKLIVLGSLVLAFVILYLVCRLMRRWLGISRPARVAHGPFHGAARYAQDGSHGAWCHRAERHGYHPPPPPPRPPQPVVSRPRARGPSWVWPGIGLLIVGLVAFGFRTHQYKSHSARRPPAVNQAPAVPQVQRKPADSRRDRTPAEARTVAAAGSEASWSVKGIGATPEDAHQKALSKAQNEFLAYLHAQSPPVDWTPPAEFLRTHLKIHWGPETAEWNEEFGRDIYQVTLNVEVTPENREEILQQAHHYRVEQRQLWLAKVFAVVVVLLVGVAGYIRLDEWSKGYYTGLLRLGLLALIAAAGAGVWWFARH